MKRLLFFISILFFASVGLAQLFPFPYVTAPKGLRLRNAPSVQEGQILAIIPPFSVVEVVDRGKEEKVQGLTGNWVKIFWNGKTGWTFDAYMNYSVNEMRWTRDNSSYSLKQNPILRINQLAIKDLARQSLERKWGKPIQKYLEGFTENTKGVGINRVYLYPGVKFVFIREVLDHIEINADKKGLDNLFSNGISKIELAKFLSGRLDESYYMARNITIDLKRNYRAELSFSADNVLRRIILRIEHP